MGKETELKFLLYEGDQKYSTPEFNRMFGSKSELEERVEANGVHMSQAYLEADEGVQLANELGLTFDFDPTTYRIRKEDDSYNFTVKGFGHVEKAEVIEDISKETFDRYFEATACKISQVRLKADYHGKKIEINLIPDHNLITAEIEGDKGDTEADLRALPEPGKDISTEVAYKMQVLAGQNINK